ncbi:MAG: hypothetical protein ACE367_05930 [Acidimicrobiales bacterium]
MNCRRPIPHIAAVLVALTIGLVATTGVAGAQNLDAIIEDVVFRGYAVEFGADADINEIEDALGPLGDEIALVVLVDDAAAGADRVADEVRSALEGDVTVLVISPAEVGATSDTVDDAVLDAALDGVIDDLDDGRGFGATTARFADAVGIDTAAGAGSAAQAPPDGDGAGSGADDGGSGGGVLIFLLVIVAVGVGLFFFLRSRGRQVDARDVETARNEIRAQLAAVATEIVENEATVDLSGNDEAIELFRDANATYIRVSEEIDETNNLLDLAELSDDIDRARWQAEAAEALVEGRTPPPAPEPDAPAACFFDPTHKPGTAEATLRTPAGEKDVRVCRSCAERLERGEVPDPRMIDVGGRRVPAAKAPRSHGGLGMGGLSVFEIILGGLAAAGSMRGRDRGESGGRGIDWGDMMGGRSSSSRSSRSQRSSGSFGMDRLPSRPRSLPRSPASRPSGQRTRSTSSKGAARGRARRRR